MSKLLDELSKYIWCYRLKSFEVEIKVTNASGTSS